MGNCSVGIFKSIISKIQRNLIHELRPKNLYFILDPDVFDENIKYTKLKDMAGFFKPFVERAAIVKLPREEDPASFGKDSVDDWIGSRQDCVITV